MAKKSTILLNLLDWPPRQINRILECYSELDEILEISASQLRKDTGLGTEAISQLLRMRDSQQLRRELAAIRDEAITCIDVFDPAYPALLKQIANPPVVLYVRGDADVLTGPLFAIVGSRQPTPYGLSMAEDFSAKLSSLGVVIVSGLAHGIDTAAHKAAVKNGKTIAVLGSGLLRIYPRDNEKLSADVMRHGALISEFSLFESAAKENFPRRNRIISGLSRGVLVVEAAQRSGALITAHLAAEQNREVFAVPGNINSDLSKGTNALIKEGAQPVDCPEDILEAFGIKLGIGKLANKTNGKILSYC